MVAAVTVKANPQVQGGAEGGLAIIHSVTASRRATMDTKAVHMQGTLYTGR